MDTDGVARYGCRWVGETVIRRWDGVGWQSERIRGWVGWCRAELIANPLDYVSWMGISTCDDGRPIGKLLSPSPTFSFLSFLFFPFSFEIKKECASKWKVRTILWTHLRHAPFNYAHPTNPTDFSAFSCFFFIPPSVHAQFTSCDSIRNNRFD